MGDLFIILVLMIGFFFVIDGLSKIIEILKKKEK